MAKNAKFTPVKKGTDQLPWRLNIPASMSSSGRRERKFFATKTEADTAAKIEQTRVKNFGSTSSGLTPAQQEAAASAYRLLGEVSPSKLIEIVERHLAHKEKLAASITLEELRVRFTEVKKKRSEKYRRQIRLAFERLTDLGSRRLPEIQAADIDGALKPLAESNRSLHLRVLRAAFNYAVKNKWITENPVSSLDFTTENSGEVQVLLNKQSARLIIASKRLDIELLPYHLFGLFAGIRPEELSRMQWEHVRQEEQHIVLPKTVTKTGRRRVITIEPVLNEWIQWLIDNHGSQKGAITPRTNLRRRLRAIRKKAGIKAWVQDIMRHTRMHQTGLQSTVTLIACS